MLSLSLTKALCAILSLNAIAPVSAAPVHQSPHTLSGRASDYWFANVDHTQDVAFGASGGYTVYRNVRDYGAKGDGVTDDWQAINNAMTSGTRCGHGCNSSTTTPAVVYFPAGKYAVSQPIVQYYYTIMVGDPNNLPTITATGASFKGIALIDSDPYDNTGANWYINQNNFFRQIRNFIIDLTPLGDSGAGIHWQVAQATSLQNIRFVMTKDASTKQIGIFMDNGSGGFMSDLIFEGGQYGAFFGNQQFTTRNLVFNGCQTAIFMNWNWGWTLSNITVDGSGAGISNTTGLDMSNSPTNQTVGSVVLHDSSFRNIQYGVRSAYKKSGNVPKTGGTLIIDNVDLTGASSGAVVDVDGNTILPSGKITAWAEGNGAANSTSVQATQGPIQAAHKPQSLLNGQGQIYARSKPQYESLSSSSFVSVKSAPYNAKGDGSNDDTEAIQNLVNAVANTGNVAYFPNGAYKVTKTIYIPPNVKIVGSLWPYILASGFTDVNHPAPVFQIGKPGDSGSFEMSDMLFGVLGPNPGAIALQWNMKCQQGQCGIWDTHVRMGGSSGTNLQLSNCAKNPAQTSDNTACEAGFLMFHASSSAQNVYLENTWFWAADHDMEDPLNQQISVYQGRGVLINAKDVWLWGSASEHSQLYNYQYDGAQNVWAGFIQTETPYMQPNSPAPGPFTFNSDYDDPTFTICNGANASSDVPCKDSWGLRCLNSQGVLVYSAGFYSFFNNYGQDCVDQQNCQLNMIHIQNCQMDMYAVTTKAAVNMIADDLYANPITDAQNRDVYGATVAYYQTPA